MLSLPVAAAATTPNPPPRPARPDSAKAEPSRPVHPPRPRAERDARQERPARAAEPGRAERPRQAAKAGPPERPRAAAARREEKARPARREAAEARLRERGQLHRARHEGRELARRARPPGSEPRLRDAPLELLPAPESLDLASRDLPRSPRAACLVAARRAEQVHDLPPGLLVAVAMSESSLHAHALRIAGRTYHPHDKDRAKELIANAPRRAPVMAGCVQVNARVHARGSDWPLDPVRSADWGGGMIRRFWLETGSWETALQRWSGGNERTAHNHLCRIRAKLEVANPQSEVLRDYACAPAEIAAVRRDGRRVLEVAEAPERMAPERSSGE